MNRNIKLLLLGMAAGSTVFISGCLNFVFETVQDVVSGVIANTVS